MENFLKLNDDKADFSLLSEGVSLYVCARGVCVCVCVCVCVMGVGMLHYRITLITSTGVKCFYCTHISQPYNILRTCHSARIQVLVMLIGQSVDEVYFAVCYSICNRLIGYWVHEYLYCINRFIELICLICFKAFRQRLLDWEVKLISDKLCWHLSGHMRSRSAICIF